MSHLNINGVDKPLDHIRLNNVRTENLFDSSVLAYPYDLDLITGLPDYRPDSTIIRTVTTAPIDVTGLTQVTLTYSSTVDNTLFIYSIFNNDALIERVANKSSGYTIPLNGANKLYVCFYNANNSVITDNLSDIMLNTGSTALPYQPYLITKEAWEAKSRVILHGLTNPLCGIDTYKDTLDLSTGPLTRYIRKLVFDGTESWTVSESTHQASLQLPITAVSRTVVSSHYKGVVQATTGNAWINASLEILFIMDTVNATNVTVFKQFLATQYSAGTPVTVWYVMATPETEQITIPSHLTGTLEGYLTRTVAPTPTNPIYPIANGTLEQGGTYSLDTGAYAIAWGRADTFTGTNSISARCYGLPVKSWEIDGNSQQSGTPTQDDPIMPEFVGERTVNIMPASPASTHEENGLTFTSNGSGIYTVSGIASETTLYIFRLNSTFTIPVASRQGGHGTFSLFNSQAPSETGAPCRAQFFLGDTQQDTWSLNAINRRANNYGTMGGLQCDGFGLYISAGVEIDMQISPVFTDNDTYPDSYIPYGYAIQTSSSTQNTVSGQTPLTLTDSVGHNLISWDGEGATTSSGTPAPTSPVTVSGWGDKTENLFDEKLVVGFYNDNVNTIYESPNYRSFRIQGLPSGQYTVSWNIPVRLVRAYYDGVLYENIGEGLTAYTVTSSDGDIAFSFRDETSTQTPWSDSNTVMLNAGSTALQYEPYGWKLSFTSAGQTTPVYLGQVPTTRKVKKLVLTGDETGWTDTKVGSNHFFLSPTLSDGATIYIGAPSTHYMPSNEPGPQRPDNSIRQVIYGVAYSDLSIRYDACKTLTDFKLYLQQQYAAGTPVVVWYVLAEPTTGIVNEPLMKIGNYADSITSIQAEVTIPIAKGNATLTTSNTVQPSIMHATYDKYISGGDVPVYLGQVPTIRRVRKLVLTGNESWDLILSQTTNAYFYIRIGDYMSTIADMVISTHFAYANISTSTTGIGCDIINSSGGGEDRLAIRPNNASNMSIADFTTWLAAQYAAGTPITIWYVLAEPETGIVNEPLCKIGDYTDKLTSDQAGVTIPTTDGNNTISVDTSLSPSKFEVKVHAKPIHYGFKIDKSFSDPSDAVIYTHAAVTMTPAGMNFTKGVFDYGSWENVWFIKNARPVMLNFDGTEAYDLDPNDYSKKLDGTPSDIADSTKNMNAMIAFPTVWIKRTDDGIYNYIEISDQQLDSDFHAYAHEDANCVVKPYIYLPIYKGSLVDGKLRSISGVKPQSNTTAQQEVDAASALGTGWQIWDYTSKEMLCDLLTLISKSLDTQGKFGQGHSTGGSTVSDFLNCGTLNNKGKFFGYSTTASQVKCFGMEALWAERWERELGLILDAGIYKIKEHPVYNLTGEGYTAISTSVATCPTSSDYIKTEVSTQFGSLPTVVGGTQSTYYCDYFYQNQSDIRVAMRGGGFVTDVSAGLRYVYLNNSAAISALNIGASPVYK